MKCIICDQNKWTKHLDGLVRCNSCGFIRAHDKYFKVDPFKFYDQSYFITTYGNYSKEQVALEKNFIDRLKTIRKYKANGKLLEIGCAQGYFLKNAHKYFDCFGIDLSPAVTKITKKNTKAEIFTGDFLKRQFPKNYFDVICMFDTIEHLKLPDKYIEKISEVLKPNGIVVVETGNIESFMGGFQKRKWRLIMLPDHLQYFSKESLTTLLKNYGFKIKLIKSVGFFRTFRQIIYRLTNNKNFLNSDNKLLDKSISLNTFDLIFIIAQKSKG